MPYLIRFLQHPIQLKERMSRELEEAVEKERAAVATRLREVSERYEQQLQVGVRPQVHLGRERFRVGGSRGPWQWKGRGGAPPASGVI